MHDIILIAACLLTAGTPDTLATATVTAEKGVIVSRTDTVKTVQGESVTDALMKIPGMQMSDLGGAAGLKTAGLRGMGTANTSIYIDGVKVGNIQSGQGDLGMISLENASEVIVDYAQNSISFNTARPSFYK